MAWLIIGSTEEAVLQGSKLLDAHACGHLQLGGNVVHAAGVATSGVHFGSGAFSPAGIAQQEAQDHASTAVTDQHLTMCQMLSWYLITCKRAVPR